MSLLAKGLNFCPVRHLNSFETIVDMNKFARKLTLRKHYYQDTQDAPQVSSDDSMGSESSVCMGFQDMCAARGVCWWPGGDRHATSGGSLQVTIRLLPCELQR